jgi:hypothetical protein
VALPTGNPPQAEGAIELVRMSNRARKQTSLISAF